MFTCSPDGDEIDLLRRRLMEALSQPALIDGQSVNLSASVGVASYPQDAAETEGLLLKAESAMRDAQSRGGGFSFYNAEADARAARRLHLENMLHGAIERDELKLAYQPLIDLTSNRIVGVEALLRWPQPDGSWIGPDEFVPVAEDAGLMYRIGAFVLDEACRQLKAWHDDGIRPLRMSVNVSKCQVTNVNFSAVVHGCLQKYKLPPDSLDLELSERGVLSDNRDVLSLLSQLKRIGVTLSIDDFGTGDAAIGYLKELPVDTLKIDRSYVKELVSCGAENAMTSAMIALGQKLSMTIVAEGVESREQLAILESFGCDQYQGFYRSPAVAPKEIVKMFRQS
jgi:EAL domain-containing protein (putative c-di-GMP-specific phosphodiesterase class I)